MPILEIDIDIKDDKWTKKYPDIDEQTRFIIAHITNLLIETIPHIEISIVLANDSFIQELNKKHRNKDAPTNVLSFPQTDAETLVAPAPFLGLGDIVFAYETIAKEAAEQNKKVKNHFTHMLVHGCLHLLHYDHETNDEAQEMEELEIDILEMLNIKNPYEKH